MMVIDLLSEARIRDKIPDTARLNKKERQLLEELEDLLAEDIRVRELQQQSHSVMDARRQLCVSDANTRCFAERPRRRRQALRGGSRSADGGDRRLISPTHNTPRQRSLNASDFDCVPLP